MFRIEECDERAVRDRWGIGKLGAKLIACAQLKDDQIEELLDQSTVLQTSEADCVKQCAARILDAKEKGRKVFVGGDYDADGICSTAIMKRLLDRLGIENGYYIPDRFREGYGLKAHTAELAAAKGYSLIITVDNGVKAHEALQKAKELGLEIIVTDHHVIEEPVEADLLVHPDYMEERFRTLSGAGVALQISRTLIGNDECSNTLAAVAAIGDVMPLWKETRVIVRSGLSNLSRHVPYPLYALLNAGARADAVSVAFQIVPKLNSLGRMNDISNVNTLVPYLLSENPDTVRRYAAQVNAVNERRKELSEIETEKAKRLCTDEGIQLIYDETFHEGVCGLVAGRLAEELKKPVVVLSKNGDTLKASGRSVEGFDMFDFFSGSDVYTAFGGHAMAVGFSLREEDWPLFRKQTAERFRSVTIVSASAERKAVLLEADDVNLPNLYDLNMLDPLPKELQEIAFAVPAERAAVTWQSAKMIKYTVPSRTGGFEAVLYTRRNIPVPARPRMFIGTLSVSRYRSRVTPQLTIEDII